MELVNKKLEKRRETNKKAARKYRLKLKSYEGEDLIKAKIRAKKYADDQTQRTQEKWKLFKQRLKCQQCGENHPACIEFHHLDPIQKEYNISHMKHFSKEKLENELTKCIVLCSNCHKKAHYELNLINKATKS